MARVDASAALRMTNVCQGDKRTNSVRRIFSVARNGVSEPGGQDFYVGAVEPARGEEIQVALVLRSQG